MDLRNVTAFSRSLVKIREIWLLELVKCILKKNKRLLFSNAWNLIFLCQFSRPLRVSLDAVGMAQLNLARDQLMRTCG
jgi:hypothetical protein